MLTELADGENIIALSFEGRLEKDDIERAMNRLDAAFEQGGPVHLFIEVRDFQGRLGGSRSSASRAGYGPLRASRAPCCLS